MRDASSVVVDGARLVWRHLPVLLVLFLLGAAVRGGVIWIAVEVSDDHPLLAQLILPLAPIGTLAAIIFMLRTLSPSLRHASFDAADSSPAEPTTRSRGGRLGLLASMLVPFLTVYSAQGFLEADRRQFINQAAFQEFRASADFFYSDTSGPNRFMIGGKVFLLGVIVVAFVIRRLINRFELAEKHTGVGLFAAYVEIFWIFSLAVFADQLLGRYTEWRDTRALTIWGLDTWHRVVEALGPVGVPLKVVVDAVGGVIANGTDLIVVPIAWLTVGAVAYGRRDRLAAPDVPVVPPSTAGRWRRSVDAVAARTQRVPAPVRRIGANATADLRDRFRTFADGVRLLVVAGLVPMLLFCVVFMVARGVHWGVGELLRVLRGPVDASTGIAFLPWFGVAQMACYTVMLVGLIAAAVDRIIARRDEAEAASRGPAPTTPTDPAATTPTNPAATTPTAPAPAPATA
ncbi:MAG: hypothetical protein JWP82_1837 [Humibacillus sp.]|nr:hypothetical protein [Humibacillus sp.]